MINMPIVKMGLVAVSRDCFPTALCRARTQKVMAACRNQGVKIVPCKTIIESETDALKAVAEMRAARVNAVAIYLGNFGPEGPTTIFAQKLGVPFMLCAAAEESKTNLVDGRGDAFCGMLNACLNTGLRKLRPYLPQKPVGLPDEIAKMIAGFMDVARVMIGLGSLKIFGFGPRPQDFYACNAPIKPLYDIGIEVMENSELDLLQEYQSSAGKKQEIKAVAREMAKELGKGNLHPEKLNQLAQFELALLSFYEKNRGASEYGIFANKCWPTFEQAFGFVPCYVNSRLAARGIPVACEVDIYGALSEYIAQLASGVPVTLLDINNTVPNNLPISNMKGAAREDLFMGFHCGNTPRCHLCPGSAMKYQLIMHRLMEPGKKPNITCGTLEGTLRPGPITVFRLQSTLDNQLHSYLSEGHILEADPSSFGGLGIFGIRDFGRFYRHVLLEKQFPHHTAVAFTHAGRVIVDALKLLGIENIYIPLPATERYSSENPFLR